MLKPPNNVDTDGKHENDAHSQLQKQLEANLHKLEMMDEHIKIKKVELERKETEIEELKKGYTGHKKKG